MSPDRPLSLPTDLPGKPGPLSGPSDALAYAGPARGHPFLVASRSASLRGTESGGVAEIELHGSVVLTGLTTGAGACANVVLGPRSLRRELIGPGGSVLETAITADRHPGIVAQWVASGGVGLAVDIHWTVPGRASAHRASGSMLRVRPEQGPDRLFYIDPAPGTWDMKARPDGLGVRVRVRSDDGRVTLVVVQVATDQDGADLLRTLLGTEALANRAASFSRAVRTDRLAIQTGAADLDDALAWAVARTAASSRSVGARRGPPRSEDLEPFWTTCGALAAGDRETARALVDRPPECIGDVLSLARWVLWTADPRPLTRHRAAALAVLDENRVGTAYRAARSTIRRALEAVGEAPDVTGLEGPAPVELPILGGPSSSGSPEGPLLSAILLGGPFPVATDVRTATGVDRALSAWALLSAGHPDAGYALLHEHLAQGLRTAAGLWTIGVGSATSHDPVSAALVPAIVLCGLLGARSEAPWGRLSLAPRLPGTWTRFGVSGIHVGDARVSLRYETHGDRRSFVLKQTEGRVPLTVVFQPSVAGHMTDVHVDGTITDVEVVHERGRSGARLQLPLDTEREVTLVGPGS